MTKTERKLLLALARLSVPHNTKATELTEEYAIHCLCNRVETECDLAELHAKGKL